MNEPLRYTDESSTEAYYREGFWEVYDQRINNREAAHLSGLRWVAAGALLDLSGAVRGEGEPGNAGEMISVNYVQDLIQDARDEYYDRPISVSTPKDADA